MSTVILADVSGSMTELAGSRRRIDVLQAVFDQVLPTYPQAAVVAFGTVPILLEPGAALPEPGGDTVLEAALNLAATRRPSQVVVLSDGVPSDPDAALAAARALRCRIVSHFCGDEADHAAVAFMHSLSWQSADGLGATAIADLRQPERLAGELRLALAGPAA